MYKLGQIFTDFPEKGQTTKLPSAIGIKLQNQGKGRDELITTMVMQTAGTKVKQIVKFCPAHIIGIRQALQEKIRETGYLPSDFCVVPTALEMTAEGWIVPETASASIIEEVYIMQQGSLTHLICMNRDILYTDGTHWYSGSVKITETRTGIEELRSSLHQPENQYYAGRIGSTKSKLGVQVWSYRNSLNKLANDVLAELDRIFPPTKKSILSRL